MSNPRFDLVDIALTLKSKKNLLLIVVLVSAVLGGVFYVVWPKKYKAETDLIVSNPLYTDRNNLFRTRDTRFVDYFGGDDDIDRVLVISGTDSMRNTIADKLNLWEVYHLDKTDKDDRLKMKEKFQDDFKMERTEYTTAKVYYTDKDPERAAAVVNLSIEVCEAIYRGYYLRMRDNVANSLKNKIADIDKTIGDNLMQLAKLSRQLEKVNRGDIEQQLTVRNDIEEINAINAKLIEDKAQHTSLLNEFMTGVDEKDQNRYLYAISPAKAPLKPTGVGLALTIAGAALFGFFFTAIYILIVAYYRRLITSAEH